MFNSSIKLNYWERGRMRRFRVNNSDAKKTTHCRDRLKIRTQFLNADTILSSLKLCRTVLVENTQFYQTQDFVR